MDRARMQPAASRAISALIFAALLFVSRPGLVSANESGGYQDAYTPGSTASGKGLRAPDPRKINQAPKAEDFVNEGEQDLRELEPQAPDESGGMSHVRMPGERAPKIDAPKDLAPIIPENLDITPYSPLVKVNKSGVKPQVLKKPKGAGSVKGMGMTFTTNLQTGSASMSVPFALPPARAGLGPSLGLSYSSGGSQGVAGLGWSFGVGFIGRQTDQGLPRYDDDNNSDRFVYNGGRELVRVDNSTTTMPDWATNNPPYYRAKIEGLFMRFFRMTATNGIYWKAQDTNGTIYWFGGTEAGVDLSALVCDTTCDKVFRWNLVRVQDVHGNRVVYEYDKHQGQSYLWDVYYVNKEPESGTSDFQHHVAIFYEQRPDVLTSYQPGFPVTTAKRIDELRVYTDYGAFPAVGGQPSDGDARRMVRAYDLRYDASLLHSMLEEVQMFGKDNTTGLPPVHFEYSTVSGTSHVPELGYINGEVQSLQYSPSDSMGDGRRDLLDIDADGLPDVFETDPTNPGSLQKYILNSGASLPEGNKLPMGGNSTLMLQNTNVRIMDMDGDGKVEMVHMPHVGNYTVYYLSCNDVPAGQTGETRECEWLDSSGNAILVNPSIDLTTDGADYKLVDINGDHLIDIVRTTGTQMQHWLNLGAYENGEGKFGHVDPNGNLSDQPITSCVLHKGLPVQFSDNRVKLADVNGDGLQDIVLVDYGSFVYWPNKGYGDWGVGGACPAGQFGANRYITMANAPMFSNMDVTKIYLGDVNGDGLADMMQVRFDAVDVWLNAIDGFKPRAILQNSPTAPQFTDRVRLADINGSGSRDIVWGDGGNYRYIDLTGGIKPRVLIRAHNGLGGITEVDYASSTDEYLADREDGREWQTTCPFPSQVVKEVRTRDQFDVVSGYDESIYIKRYRYSDCYYDGEEHEFRGFAEVTEEAVGDDNSPTSFVTHHYYQGKPDETVPGYTLESLSGAKYRTDVYAYKTSGSADRVYLSTSFTSYAVRKVLDAHAEDLIPGLDPNKARTVRFSYAAESHSFGYNTHEQYEGSITVTSRPEPGLLRARVEDGTEPPPEELVSLDLPIAAAQTTHIKSKKKVNEYGQTTQAKAHGEVDSNDDVIVSYSHYNQNEAKWIHRVCETYVRDDGDLSETNYNHKRQIYDHTQVIDVFGASVGQYDCTIGEHGENTSSVVRTYYDGSPTDITAHETTFTRWGLPTHTRALSKLEGWVYYEDPRGYQALPTREVIRVGISTTTDDYDETPVKYLSTRVSYDPGLGAIAKYWDENDQESRAVYDTLGRIIELWGPREPNASCSSTFMKAASVEYLLTTAPGTLPYSYVKATTYEDACDLNDVKEAWSFADGLGRVRLTVGPGDFPNEYIGSGHKLFDAKGAVKEGFGPAFMGGTDQPGFSHSAPAIEGAIQASCPTDNTCIQARDAVCSATTRYDAFGRAIETTQPNRVKTKTEFHGPLVTVSFDGNDFEDSNGQGNPYSNPDFHSTPTTSTKDGHGRLLEVKQMYVNTPKGLSGNYFKGYEYDILGNLVAYMECTNDTQPSWQQCYSDGDFIEKLQHFDTVGRRREIVDPDAGTWQFTYDESGNIVETTDGKYNDSNGATGNKIGYTYDDANRLIVEKCLQCDTRPAGDILARYYFDSPQLQRGGRGYMSLPDSTGPTDDEPQDWVLGRLVRIEDDTGWVMFSYDRLGRQVTEAQLIEGRILDHDDDADPNDGINETDILDENDTIIDGNGDIYVGRVQHDDAGRITRLIYPAPSGDDASGDPIVPLEVNYEYNLRGLTSRIIGPDPLAEDPQTADPYTYLVVSTTQPYNAKGQRMDYQYLDASEIQHTKRYDSNGRLCEAKATQNATYGNTQLHYKTYTYDAASNITDINDLRNFEQVNTYTGGGNLPYNLEIKHDSLYRVIEVTYNRTDFEKGLHQDPSDFRRKMTYTYNAIGNLIERSTVRGETDGNEYTNPTDEFYEKWLGLVTDISPHADHPHAFGAASPTSIDADVNAEYDANGNMTSLEIVNNVATPTSRYELFEYTWNHYDQIIKIEKYTSSGGDPVAILYNAYDSGGQRVIKTDDPDGTGPQEPKNTLYVTDGVELRNDQYIRYITDGTQKVARIGLTKPYDDPLPSVINTRLVYVADHLGSTSVVVMDHDDQSQPGNERGCVVSTASHLPYGGIEAETSAVECGSHTDDWFRFTGKELEKAHGLLYFGARWMNPALGSFTSVDSDGAFSNGNDHLFLYVNGHVFGAIDPDGNAKFRVIARIRLRVAKPKYVYRHPPGKRNSFGKLIYHVKPWRGEVKRLSPEMLPYIKTQRIGGKTIRLTLVARVSPKFYLPKTIKGKTIIHSAKSVRITRKNYLAVIRDIGTANKHGHPKRLKYWIRRLTKWHERNHLKRNTNVLSKLIKEANRRLAKRGFTSSNIRTARLAALKAVIAEYIRAMNKYYSPSRKAKEHKEIYRQHLKQGKKVAEQIRARFERTGSTAPSKP